MAEKYFGGTLPEAREAGEADEALISMLSGLRDRYEAQMEKFQFQNGLEEIFKCIQRANKYIDETMPWALAKDEANKPRLAAVMYNLLESIRICATLLLPFIPESFCKSDFRVVKVKACERVKKSDKLLRFTLDDGTGTDRQILSGIAKFYEPEALVGKTLAAIVNLPPRKMMGQESCGMLLSAVHKEKGEEKLHLVMLDDAIPAGAKLC